MPIDSGWALAVVVFGGMVGTFVDEIRWTSRSRETSDSIPPDDERTATKRAIAEVAFLAIVADGTITDAEWAAFGEELAAQHQGLRRDQIASRVNQLVTELRDRAVIEREVRARAAKLGPDGARLALQFVEKMATVGGAALGLKSGAHLRSPAISDREGLVRLFEAWLGLKDAPPAEP